MRIFSSKLQVSWEVLAYDTVVDYTRIIGYEQKSIKEDRGGGGSRRAATPVILLGAAGLALGLLGRKRR